jgi:radical SAM protein with 4Fe4S-binding SPASM domain
MLNGLTNCHLTGGEFLLSPKLYPTVKLLKETHPDIRANMSISGFFPELTYKYMKKIHSILPQLRVDISVDGPQDIHERNRGAGSYDAVMRTIGYLRKIEGLQIQLQFTVMETNYKYLKWVWDLAQSMDLGCYVTFPHYGTRFGHRIDKSHEHKQVLIDVVDEQIKDTWCAIRSLNHQTWYIQKALWENKKVDFDCNMWKYSIDVAPNGNCYPCMVYMKDFLYGNIKTQSLTEMLNSIQGNEVVDSVIARKCQPCPMPCCPWKTNFTIK